MSWPSSSDEDAFTQLKVTIQKQQKEFQKLALKVQQLEMKVENEKTGKENNAVKVLLAETWVEVVVDRYGWMDMCMYVRTFACICMYVCLNVCMYVSMYAYTYPLHM